MRLFAENSNTDKFTIHRAYLDVYEKIFPGRYSCKKILEIGNLTGGSLAMYCDYFPIAVITGIDINKCPVEDYGRVSLVTANAYSHPIPVADTYDLIIDDGPHTVESQKFAVEFYSDLLANDGLLIVEDVQNAESFKELHSMVQSGFVGYSIDLRHINKQYDDLLFIVSRKKYK